MTCTCCRKSMLGETLVDMEAGSREMWSCTWRCGNCGHRVYAVMQQHRRAEQHVGRLTGATIQGKAVVVYEPDSIIEPLWV